MIRRIKALFLAMLLIGLAGCEMVDDLPMLSRYMAKNICAGLFVEGFEERLVIDEYITPFVPFLRNTWQVNVNYEQQTIEVTNSIFKDLDARSLHRPPIGCVSTVGQSDELLYSQVPVEIPKRYLDQDIPWPYGSGGAPSEPVEGVDYDAIQLAFDEEYAEPGGKNTVALLVVYDGQLVAEQYQESIDAFSPLKGYSMSKSLMNGLVGVLQGQGELSKSDVTGIEQWAGDERSNITIDQLLHMESGLKYTEKAMGTDNDQAILLYGTQPASVYAVNRPIETTPGTDFKYSSGDNVILSSIVQQRLGGTPQVAYNFYQNEFFDRIDITTAVVEHDAAGVFNSAENLFLSTRDWARFIYLYLNNGAWHGDQVLSEQWISESFIPSDFDQRYGANLWMNLGQEAFPGLPEDTIAFYGAMERFVVAIPSRKAIVIRMGYSHNRDAVDISAFASTILEALPND